VHVTARLEGFDLGTAMAEVKRRIASMPLPSGTSIECGGLYARSLRCPRSGGSLTRDFGDNATTAARAFGAAARAFRRAAGTAQNDELLDEKQLLL